MNRTQTFQNNLITERSECDVVCDVHRDLKISDVAIEINVSLLNMKQLHQHISVSWQQVDMNAEKIKPFDLV